MSNNWTTGPAKWAAVLVLGGASIAGMAWSIFGREQPSRAVGAPPTIPMPVQPTAAETVAAMAPVPPPVPPVVQGRLIDLNSASASELELLPGIGPATAARIIEYRTKNGRFTSVEQLDLVPRIGPRTMERLRPLVKVE